MTSCPTWQTAGAAIRDRYPHPIETAVILGSGLGDFASVLQSAIEIPYNTIPHFPETTVEGHEGVLHLGTLGGQKHYAFLQGRFHLYEGHSMAAVVFPVRVLGTLGVQNLVVTNSAGGIHPAFQAGSLMLMTDHINLTGQNPLIGPNSYGERFPDMTRAYTPALQERAKAHAKALNIPLEEGVYSVMTGPSYETPAEIRALRTLGADAVGMSTVFEVITAVQMGMNVLGLSCITNTAAGVVQGHQLSHEEVLTNANRAKGNFQALLKAILQEQG